MKGSRMICKEIYESYEFLSLLNDTECRLYTYLCLNSDDDGVVEALRVMRMINSPNSLLEKLIELDLVKLLDNRDTLYITNFDRGKRELLDASSNVASEDNAENLRDSCERVGGDYEKNICM